MRQQVRRARLAYIHGFYSVPGRVPRHGFGRGEGASARGKTNTASRWPPAHGGDEDDFVLGYFSDEGVRAGVWAVLGLRLLGCSAGFCWAASAR